MDHLGHALSPILVTGAAGYLGCRVLTLLRQRQIPVLGVAHRGGSDLQCDLLDAKAVNALLTNYPASRLLHCAAVVPKRAVDYQCEETAQLSLQMMHNLLSAQSASLERMVFISSMTVYPRGVGLARESDATGTDSAYAGAKLAAERILLARQRLGDVALRMPGLFGPPRTSGLLYNAASALARGQAPSLAAPLPQWAALHVDDAADLCVRAVLMPAQASMALNAGYPEPMSISDAILRLANLFGCAPGELPQSPVFTYDLTALHRVIGSTQCRWQERLQELAKLALINSAGEVGHA